jgi:DNA primase
VTGRIRDDDIKAVRERTDLVRLVQQYVALKKAGRRWVGLCPFHSEKTPSFGISPEQGLYYCHGCGKGGDAFRFIQEIEGLDFPEAAERLAAMAGVSLRYEGASPGERRSASKRQALHRANERAGELYLGMLKDGREAEEARRYLETRSLTPESIEAFGIGYAPGYADFLLRRLARDLSTEILVDAGLAMKDARGGVRDRFRSRVMFPIHDVSGKPVGFGARLLDGDGPKYLNTAETSIYRKSDLLYNLHRAKTEITKTGRVFVVEGYTDVIALAQAGIPTAVATCGTALGEGHFRLISRFTPRKVVLAFDSDEAGARAAERAHGLFETFNLNIHVLVLPDGVDPADFVIDRGGDEFEKLADEAEPLIEFMLNRAVRDIDRSTPEGQSQAVHAGLPIIARLQDEVLRDRYIGVLADLAAVQDTVVKRELARGGAQGTGGPAQTTGPKGEVRSATRDVEKEMLKALAQIPDVAVPVVDAIGPEYFSTERYRRAWELLRESPGDAAGVASRATERGVPELLAEVAVEPLRGEPTKGYVEQLTARLEELTLKREMDTLRKRLERLNPVTEASEFDRLFAELTDLTSRYRSARARAGEGT